MTYPLKDRTLVKKIQDEFESHCEDYKKKDYDEVMKKIKKSKIKDAVTSKLVDRRLGKEKAFESIPCRHTEKNRFETKTCKRCQFNEREFEFETIIRNLSGDEKADIEQADGTTIEKTFSGLKVKRGKYDDVIGYHWEWK